ncbi:MAG TPA: hypothetical protein VED41_04915, partial [Solirubrobacteraceae bacterium]|nr:hypothetical protein [Solirubrobacteraceae bacterium]
MIDEPPHTEAELIELVRSIDVRAPQQLHERVEALVAEHTGTQPRRRPARRWGLLAGAPALAAALAVALAVILSNTGTGSSLTLSKAVALTLRPATMTAPAENPTNGSELMASADGVPFPYWEESFGFRATGMRVDRMDNRTVTTVFYADSHKRWIGYAIVAGTPAPTVSGGVVIDRAGTAYRLSADDGARVVTWLRDGRLCVVAGHG